MTEEHKNWFKRHPIWTTIFGLIILGLIASPFLPDEENLNSKNNQVVDQNNLDNTQTTKTQEEPKENNYQLCIKEIFKTECQKYSLLYTDYSEAVQFITCTDDGSYTVNDLGESSKYLQVYAPTRILELKCGVYQEPTNPKLKCEEELFKSKCEDVSLIYTDWSSAVGFITCTDDGLYTTNDISSDSKYQQVYITQEFVDSQCS